MYKIIPSISQDFVPISHYCHSNHIYHCSLCPIVTLVTTVTVIISVTVVITAHIQSYALVNIELHNID